MVESMAAETQLTTQPPSEVHDQVRVLIALATKAMPRAPDEGTLLDVKVDGVRCVLRAMNIVAAPAGLARLSPREQEIGRMVALGYTNKLIANVLDISLWTVSTHLRRMYAKLGVSSRAALVAITSRSSD